MNYKAQTLGPAAMLLLIFLSLFASSRSYAGCGGVCISTAPYSSTGSNQTIHIDTGDNITLYAKYDGCCAALFGNNAVVGWYLNNSLIATTTVAMNNGGYNSSHQLAVSQPGNYTVTFGSAATDSAGAYYNPCGRVTITNSALPMPAPGADNTAAPADDLVILDNTGFFIPGAFTPDGNGVNDLFKPVYTTAAPSDYCLQIFDKMGNLVFETRDASEGWDGRVRSGRPAQVDIYIWKIEHGNSIVSMQPTTGKVCVIR
jgi:gliding motility-associated-like protein